MEFVNPEIFTLLVMLPVIGVLLVWSNSRRRIALGRIGDPRLILRLTNNLSLRKRSFKVALWICAFLLLIFAAARPLWGTQVSVQLCGVGIHETPPSMLIIQNEGDDPYEIEARPLRMDIVSILPTGDESGLEKRDLKPQMDLPKHTLWPWLMAAMCTAMLLFLAGRWLWRKISRRYYPFENENVPVVRDSRLPEDIAYACLDRIARMNLPGIGAFKQHYTMVTDCIRQYLQRVYDIPAVDLSTTELRCALLKRKVEDEILSLLWELLEQADMVKFARFRPEVAHARNIVRWGRHFVDCTKPERQSESVITQKVE